MSRRRSAYNPLETTTAPRWLVVRSMHGTVLEARRLVDGEHLQRVFVAEILRRLDAGWRVGEFSSAAAMFFCEKDTDRCVVTIDPTNPHEAPPTGAAHLGGASVNSLPRPGPGRGRR
jgi:hypothetical protein